MTHFNLCKVKQSCKILFTFIFYFSIITVFGFPDGSDSSSLDNKKTFLVYKYDIKEEIAPPVLRKTQNAFKIASQGMVIEL